MSDKYNNVIVKLGPLITHIIALLVTVDDLPISLWYLFIVYLNGWILMNPINIYVAAKSANININWYVIDCLTTVNPEGVRYAWVYRYVRQGYFSPKDTPFGRFISPTSPDILIYYLHITPFIQICIFLTRYICQQNPQVLWKIKWTRIRLSEIPPF